MALYREGKAAMAADGTVTGTGTKWQSSLSLIRPGATIMFLSSPIQMAVVNKVVSDTEIKAITTKGAVVASSDYAILLSDSLTVDGLAQDVAETLRYYQSQETVIADAVEFFKTFDFESLQNIANQVKADSQSAGASATAAAASERAAKTSETNAKASENKAKTSETNAKASETAAKTSETNAKASETAAKTSETNAKSSENKAKTSETNAKASETAAKTSETNAKASETAAKTSETNAKASETAAKTSETNAKASETAANSAKNDAQTAKGQTQSLRDQVVDLVSGVQAPDKLSGVASSSESWMKIANIKNAGSGYAFVQFIIGGGSDYGAENVPVDIFSLSGRGLPASPLTSGNIDTWFTQRTLIAARPNAKRVNLGAVKKADASYDIYLHAPGGWIPSLWLNLLNVQANNGSITGPIIDRTGYSWITTEPVGIVYNSPSNYLLANDSTIPRTNVANTFSQPQVISSTLTLGTDATSAMHAVTKQQMDTELAKRSRFQQFDGDTRVVDPSGNRYLFVGDRSSNNDWGVWDLINSAKVALPISSGGTGALTASQGWINLLNGRGASTARSDLGLGSLATLSTVSKNQLDNDLIRGTMFSNGRNNSQGAGVWTYDNTSFGWGEQYATCIQVSNRVNSDAGAGNGIWQHYLALCTSGNLLYAINIHGNYASYRIWSSRNTTVDGSGFIKQASPIVRVVSDVDSMTPNFLEGFTLSGNGSVNDEAEGAVVSKIGTGKYSISGTTGLYPDGWQIEVPKDVNGNRLCFIEVSYVDGLILINSFKPKLDLETGGIKAGDPIDIPIGRWVDVRVCMPDDSIYNQKQNGLVSE
ncbi:putative tail fiber protein [Klebsiella phage BUCT556A]|uniref:Tail fiber protein n=1 Tax=Klebsiella phage BUCT556A TaxID=2928431 RepID=A0AAE9HFB3_9CAUD|nr:putative tail fiber protein [Klebsiella phage BUCT556A]